MSESITATPSEPIPADFEGDAFDEWIDGATVSKRSVAIYGKPGLFAEYEQLERDLDVAEAAESGGEELGGSASKRIRRRLAEIYAEWMDSKSNWVVRALSEEDFEDIKETLKNEGVEEPDDLPEPTRPKDLPARPSEQQSKSHTLRMAEYEAAKTEYNEAYPEHAKAVAAYADELNLRIIATAVDRVEFASGRVQESITVAQLRSLKSKLGERQLLSLINASQLAMYQEPEIPAPFLRTSSEDDQT